MLESSVNKALINPILPQNSQACFFRGDRIVEFAVINILERLSAPYARVLNFVRVDSPRPMFGLHRNRHFFECEPWFSPPSTVSSGTIDRFVISLRLFQRHRFLLDVVCIFSPGESYFFSTPPPLHCCRSVEVALFARRENIDTTGWSLSAL
jgi:hypothetical protein